ncbi:MAG: metalloprotease PmbA [Rhodocyclales bacterium]|nr:metalloprotease PmbA [Rhodocyclales bacterium]
MSGHEFSYTQERLRELAQAVIDHARKLGASACETDVSEGLGQSVTVRRGEVETIEYNRDKGIGVTVYLGQRRGHASTSDFSLDALRATVEAALSIARFTAEDSAAGLPDAQLLARETPDLDLFHPWHLPVEEAIDLARRCEQAAFAVSPLVTNTEGASVSAQQSQFASANSLGFMGGYATTRHYLSCAPIVGKGDHMQRDDWYSGHRDPADLASAEAIGDYAARRALSRLKARKLKTREVPILLEAPLAAGLIASFVHAVSGGSLYRKSSFLVDSLGKPVFPSCVRIDELAHLKKGLGSSPFDDDGVATRDRCVIDGGVLQGYFLSTYTARKLGMETTGNAGGSHNLIVAPGALDFRGLLKEMGTGLLVTELLGHGINYVTGDYSRGAAGYWVEGGEIAYPVQEITVAGNLRDMFRGIVAIGNDVVVRGAKQVGSILIERMTVAGN